MPLADVDLYRITAEIFSAMLGLELKPNHPVDVHPPEDRVVTGCVHISGDWQGALAVQCSEQLARTAASLMFAMEDDELTDEEVADTMGELANMIGGNIKSLLAGSCQLSLPTVSSGRDFQVSIPGAGPIDRAACDADGRLVALTLFQRTGGPG